MFMNLITTWFNYVVTSRIRNVIINFLFLADSTFYFSSHLNHRNSLSFYLTTFHNVGI